MQGTVKKIVAERGFGFIRGPQGVEYFFHHSALVGRRLESLQEGDRVSFEEDKGASSGKGPRAGSVTPQ